MSPLIEGISQRVGNGARPGQKLFIGRRISGTVALRDSVCSHRPPFIVISFQPDLEQILELAVGGDVGRGQMRVIVHNRLVRGVLVIEPSSYFGVEKEVIVDEVQNDGSNGTRSVSLSRRLGEVGLQGARVDRER